MARLLRGGGVVKAGRQRKISKNKFPKGLSGQATKKTFYFGFPEVLLRSTVVLSLENICFPVHVRTVFELLSNIWVSWSKQNVLKWMFKKNITTVMIRDYSPSNLLDVMLHMFTASRPFNDKKSLSPSREGGTKQNILKCQSSEPSRLGNIAQASFQGRR